MKQRVLLDLFCGAGGASMGYYRAGFQVVGVDIKPQPHYPFMFIQADAMTFDIRGVDAVHASPPCQAYTRARVIKGNDHQGLVPLVRDRLVASGIPWVMENVPGAPMRPDLRLCGCQFSLPIGQYQLRRERWFELSWPCLALTSPCHHYGRSMYVFGHDSRAKVDARRQAMGIDWMNRNEMSQAIPPAFTEFVGQLLMSRVNASQVA